MLCCLNPDCPRPLNPDVNKFCQACSTPLVSLLRNRFRVMRVLSNEGGFGKTYLAEDTDKLNEHCVIKQLAPKVQGTWAVKKAMELFGEEAKRLQDLGEHPQIPTLFAYFEQDNFLYLVQQFIEGQNLLNELEQAGRYSESKAKELLLDLLPLLKFIHERQVIHRDIKPENIMRRQSDGRLILIDFGVSKQLTSTVHTQMGTTIGSHGYSPIEQIKGGEAYPASDLFALGATCFHLLTGIFPFDLWVENGFAWVHNWRQYLPSPLSGEFGQVLDKLLKKDIDERYQFADKVINDLAAQQLSSPLQLSVSASTQRGMQLKSAVGMDYSRLRDLLASKKWKLANQETERVMFIIAKREEEGWLRVQDINNFLCTDLRTINQLWVEYSNGRFGFSVQKQIYQGLGGTRTHSFEIWDTFGEAVGWKKRSGLWRCGWVNYSAITFDIKAPKGHLPVWKWTLYIHSVDTFNSLYSGGVDWGNRHGWDWISSLALRLENCNI
ncbi:hypothetical protein ANSO36C_15610 [Nostoc cf. commune SO-36]|uniref:non-specific serine/threonine protein kinase n=2 Tax=Nostoc commune TaxID=1178 RepID=A0ABN6PZ63_NOSCO|nr:hypothetical protein ANSO36C_15610 [Nostoc cf. commune SO-36]